MGVCVCVRERDSYVREMWERVRIKIKNTPKEVKKKIYILYTSLLHTYQCRGFVFVFQFVFVENHPIYIEHRVREAKRNLIYDQFLSWIHTG